MITGFAVLLVLFVGSVEARACPEGFVHLLGSKPGRADHAAGGKVTGVWSSAACAKLCATDCQGFEWSMADKICLLHSALLPAANQRIRDYIFCARDEVDKPHSEDGLDKGLITEDLGSLESNSALFNLHDVSNMTPKKAAYKAPVMVA